MRERLAIWKLPSLGLLLLALCSPPVVAKGPNFLLILADDHGYGDVSTYHPSNVQTPHIDRLAAEGMLFTAMRANCTVCSPSRAALLRACESLVDRKSRPSFSAFKLYQDTKNCDENAKTAYQN